MRRSLAAAAALIALFVVAVAAGPQGKPNYKGKRQIICKGAAIPAGWLLVDDSRDVSSCGGSNPAVVNAYNVWVIEDYTGAKVDAVMHVCITQPVPNRWVMVDIYRDKNLCGHPDDPYAVNVKIIRKNN